MSGATAGTRGFLFCDLRGYAAYVDRHGDLAAAELLATYRTLVREAIASHEGAEIRTEGDSVYVVFPTASAAVEAGLGIVAAAVDASTHERPIAVGVGVHAGETVASEEGPVGGAVNIAARVCAKAQAGEVLVTDTVRSLTRTLMPYRFVGLGPQRLKGIGSVPLYRVEAVPASRLAHLRRRLSARRRLVVGSALVLVVALVGATAAWAVTRPPDCLVLDSATRDVVARIDPARGCIVAVYQVGRRPGPIAVTDSAVWVGNTDSWSLWRLDPITGDQQTVGLPGRPLSVAATARGDIVALAHNDRAGTTSRKSSKKWLAHIAATDMQVLTDYELPILIPTLETVMTNSDIVVSGFARAVVWGDRVLITNQVTGQLGRCGFGLTGLCTSGVTAIKLKDPSSTPNPAWMKPAAGTDAIAIGAGAAWIGDQTEPTLYRYDGGGAASAVSLDDHGGTTAMVATETIVWLLRTDATLTAYDPTPAPGTPRSIVPEGTPTTLAATATSVWVGDVKDAAVRRIDPEDGKTLVKVSTGGSPSAVAIAADGSVWVTISGS